MKKLLPVVIIFFFLLSSCAPASSTTTYPIKTEETTEPAQVEDAGKQTQTELAFLPQPTATIMPTPTNTSSHPL